MNHLHSRSSEVVPGGFEPPLTEPKPVVLPLHHRTISAAKVLFFLRASKFLAENFREISYSYAILPL